MISEQVDVLVIGAGPSGTVAASIINLAGYQCESGMLSQAFRSP